MTDPEFDVLDELYFVQSFHHLKETLQWEDSVLIRILEELIGKGWVKCFREEDVDESLAPDEIHLATNYARYCYLATKEGLLAHNSR